MSDTLGVRPGRTTAHASPSHSRKWRSADRSAPKIGRGEASLALLATVFLFSLLVPIYFHVGPIRLSPYRLVLFSVFFPLFLIWLTGGAGRILREDLLIFLSCLWSALSFAVVHGFANSLEPMGVAVVECFAPYLIARTFVRSAKQFKLVCRYLLVIALAIMPFALYEFLTGDPILIKALRGVGTAFIDITMEKRLGFERVQGTFEHPILFGVFFSSGVAISYYCLGRKPGSSRSISASGVFLANTFMSLSSGAFVSAGVQLALIFWDYLVKSRTKWWIAILVTVSCYVTIDSLSNRSPLQVFISYLTFNVSSAYNRILIWDYGTAEVMRHPFFGIGHNDWIRAYWMPASVDNFWLLIAMQNGLPALLLFALGVGSMCYRIAGRRNAPQEVSNSRTGLLIAIVGVSISITSVDLWNATYCWLMFLIGSGAWILDEQPKSKGGKTPRPAASTDSETTRDARLRRTKAAPLIGSIRKGPRR